MFPPMRRKGQALTQAQCGQVLEAATAGVLAVEGEDRYPYAVPLSHVYAGGKLYFHCAQVGHKLDSILRNPKVSYCVIDQDVLVREEYTTRYRSVVAFGRAQVVEDPAEKRQALLLVAQRFGPDDPAGWAREVEQSLEAVCMVVITVEHLTGKESRELAAQRQKSQENR